MYLNKIRVKELMNERSKGNYHEFARQLDIDVAQVHRVLNEKSKAGAKFLGKFMKYCQNNGLDFEYYIFLDNPLHGCNTSKRQSKSTAANQ